MHRCPLIRQFRERKLKPIDKNSKRLLTLSLLILALTPFTACSTTAVDNTEREIPAVDSEKPASYAEYKAWRDRYDPSAKEYAEFKAWEEQYRRWKWQQQQEAGR